MLRHTDASTELPHCNRIVFSWVAVHQHQLRRTTLICFYRFDFSVPDFARWREAKVNFIVIH